MAYLLDTNVVARRVLAGDPLHAATKAAVDALIAAGEDLFVTAQVIVEFRALATRPIAANGFGLTPGQASAETALIEAAFPLLPETAAIYPLWRGLVDSSRVVGRQVFDARLVAVMQAHGVTHLLTLNPAHFRVYPGIAVRQPQDVLAGT